MVILNLRNYNVTSSGVIRVDRSSPWGNPFIMTHEGDDPKDVGSRAYVCAMYREYALFRLKLEPKWLDPIKGKDLACWCAPKQCHAETLIELANYPKCKMCNGAGSYYGTELVYADPFQNDQCTTDKAVVIQCYVCEGRGVLVK